MADTKIYRAKSVISLCVVLDGGGKAHISFDPITSGASYFRTDDEEIQKGLESHYMFNRLFKLDSVIERKVQHLKNVLNEKKKAADKPAEQSNNAPVPEEGQNIPEEDPEPSDEDPEAEGDEGTDNGIKVVQVSDFAAAKDYLAENFELTRTSLRSQKSILEAAEKYGIKFEGLE